MKKLLLLVLTLAASLAFCAGPASLAEVSEILLPEPQDLATLFPGETIVTKDFGGFTISYPDSMKFEEADIENDADHAVALIDRSGSKILGIRWSDISNLADDDSTSAYDDYGVLLLVYLVNYHAGVAADAETRGEDYKYSVDPAMVSLSGRTALSVSMHTEFVSPDESTMRDGLYLLAPLDEKEALTFVLEWGPPLSERVVQSSILNTVKWKE